MRPGASLRAPHTLTSTRSASARIITAAARARRSCAVVWVTRSSAGFSYAPPPAPGRRAGALGLRQGPPQRDGLVLHLTLEPLGVLRNPLVPALDFQREGTFAEHAIDHDGQRALEADLLDDGVRGPVLECRDGHGLIPQPRHRAGSEAVKNVRHDSR